MRATRIIKAAEIMRGISPRQCAKMIGASERTYYNRRANPGTFTLLEFSALIKGLGLSQEEAAQVVDAIREEATCSEGFSKK